MSQLRPILAIAVKDLRHLARDKTAAFFVLIFPLIIALLFGAMFSGGGSGGSDGLEIAIFNEDTGDASKKFAQSLDDDSAIKVHSVASMAEGEKGVRLGDYVACLHFKPGFDPQQIFGDGVVIEGVVSPKRTAEAGLLEGKLNQLVFAQMSSMFNDPTASRKMMDNARKSVDSAEMSLPVKLALKTMFSAVDGVSNEVEKSNVATASGASKDGTASAQADGIAWQPVKVNLEKLTINSRRTPPSSFAMSFPQGVVWGLMGVVTGFASGFAAERTRGTLLRLNVSPASAWVVLGGKALACFLSCLIVQALMLGMAAVPFFNVTFGDPPLIVLVCVVTAFSLSGLAMFIAGLSRSEEAAGGLARGVLILLAMIGGGSIPLFFMPAFMRTMSNVSPFKWITQALDGAMWGGFSLAELAMPLGVLVAVGVIGFAVGAWAIGKRRVS